MCPSIQHPAADRIPLQEVPQFVLFTVSAAQLRIPLAAGAAVWHGLCARVVQCSVRGWAERVSTCILRTAPIDGAFLCIPHPLCSTMTPLWRKPTPACGRCAMGGTTPTAALLEPQCELQEAGGTGLCCKHALCVGCRDAPCNMAGVPLPGSAVHLPVVLPLCTPCRFTMQYNTGDSRGAEGRPVLSLPAGALLVQHANETMPPPLCGPPPWFTFLRLRHHFTLPPCEQTVTLHTACGRMATKSAVRGLDAACTGPFRACLLWCRHAAFLVGCALLGCVRTCFAELMAQPASVPVHDCPWLTLTATCRCHCHPTADHTVTHPPVSMQPCSTDGCPSQLCLSKVLRYQDKRAPLFTSGSHLPACTQGLL